MRSKCDRSEKRGLKIFLDRHGIIKMNLETELAKFWCHGCIVNVLNRGLQHVFSLIKSVL